MSLEKIIEDDISSLDLFLLQYQGRVNYSQSILFQELLRLLLKLPSRNGEIKLDAEAKKLILQFEERLFKSLESSKFGRETQRLIENFDKIEQVKRRFAAELNPTKKAAILRAAVNKQRRVFIKNISTQLGQKRTFSINIIRPLTQIMYESAAFGITYGDAAQRLFDVAMGAGPKGGKLAQYAGQVAHDALFGYAGSVDQAIGEHIGAKNIQYVGDLVRDSRPQCVRWVDTYNGYIPGDKIDEEIEWAKKYGTGYSHHLPDLSRDTFSIVRGGHRCRHRAIWTVGEISEKAQKTLGEYEKINIRKTAEYEKQLTGIAKERYKAAKKKVEEMKERFK